MPDGGFELNGQIKDKSIFERIYSVKYKRLKTQKSFT